MISESETMQIVYDWIVETQGEEAAEIWLWACTPFPCGLPTDEQLEEGLAVAYGKITLGQLLAKVDAEMRRCLEEHRRLYPDGDPV